MKIAAIDIGSNSVHMIIAEPDDNGAFRVVDREKDMAKLGAETFLTRRISPERFDAALDSLEKFRALLIRFDVPEVAVVATSAVREAQNGAEFIEAVRGRTGLDARVISGDEEARLIHMAVRHAIDLSDRAALILDVGGGSVEAIVGHERGVVICESLPLGGLRLRDFVNRQDPLSRSSRQKVESRVREVAGPLISRARAHGFELVIGTSGTILDLGDAVLRRLHREFDLSRDGRFIDLEDLRDLTERLLEMDVHQRARVSGIEPHRADTIHLGALLVVTILEMARVDGFVICDASIREGLVLDALQRLAVPPGSEPYAPSLSRRSVLALARRCGQAGPHAEHVSHLALQIFDQIKSVHQLGPQERRVLEYAALLHDIGRHIGFDRHERHAYYLVRNGDLRGLTDEEIELIGLVARYHRKGAPKSRHKEYAVLSANDRRAVRLLAAILRVAEGLDRGRAQAVRFVRCTVTPARLCIVAHAEGDAELEVWAARRKAGLLETVTNREMAIEVEHEDARVESDATA